MTAQLALDLVRQHQQRHRSRHREAIERLIPLAQELARKAGRDGITVGSIRLAANIATGTGRELSWLVAVPKAAGLVNTGKRRMCPQSKTRNDHAVWVSPEFR